MVDCLFEFGRHGQVFYIERGHGNAQFRATLCGGRQNALAQCFIARRQVFQRNSAFRESRRYSADEQGAKRVGCGAHRAIVGETCDCFQKQRGVGYFKRIRPVAAQTHNAEFGIDGHGIGRAPAHRRKFFCVYKVDFGLERRFKPVLPRQQFCNYGQTVGIQFVHTRAENVRRSAFVAKHSRLRFAHGQRRTLFNYIALCIVF